METTANGRRMPVIAVVIIAALAVLGLAFMWPF